MISNLPKVTQQVAKAGFNPNLLDSSHYTMLPSDRPRKTPPFHPTFPALKVPCIPLSLRYHNLAASAPVPSLVGSGLRSNPSHGMAK